MFYCFYDKLVTSFVFYLSDDWDGLLQIYRDAE